MYYGWGKVLTSSTEIIFIWIFTKEIPINYILCVKKQVRGGVESGLQVMWPKKESLLIPMYIYKNIIKNNAWPNHKLYATSLSPSLSLSWTVEGNVVWFEILRMKLKQRLNDFGPGFIPLNPKTRLQFACRKMHRSMAAFLWFMKNFESLVRPYDMILSWISDLIVLKSLRSFSNSYSNANR